MQARVKYPNSFYSDSQARVMHVVTLDDGKQVEVMAADPLDAIEKVRKQQQPRDVNPSGRAPFGWHL